MEIFTCSCSTATFCNCRKNFSGQSLRATNITTTSEMYINGEKVTKRNPIKAIFNKIISKQKKKEIKEAMQQKKLLQKINKDWVSH